MNTRKKQRISEIKIEYKFIAYNNFINDEEEIEKINYIYSWAYDDDIDDYIERFNENSDTINYRLIIALFMLFIDNDTTINPILTKNSKKKLLTLFENKSYDKFEKYLLKLSSKEEDKEINRASIILQLKHKDTDEFFKNISENIIFIPIYIQQIFAEIGKDKDKLKFILSSTVNSINNFFKFYNSSLISLNQYFLKSNNPDNNNIDIYLYRGFQYLRYKPLLDYIDTIENGKKIEISCILSTSIYEHIAYNFLNPNDIRKIVWKIKVPLAKFDKFKYSYILKNWRDKRENSSIINLTNIDKTIMNESEFILNYGIILKLINKSVISKLLPSKTTTDTIELYEFEFIDYNTSPELLNKFNIQMQKIIDNIDNKSLSI
jgi:hypothetical protein